MDDEWEFLESFYRSQEVAVVVEDGEAMDRPNL